MAAHPQHDEKRDQDAAADPAPVVVKNPFPTQMTVPGLDGGQVAVDLAVVDGTVYAPGLDELPLAPQVRQYVTQYCAAWTSSELTTGRMAAAQAAAVPPRRAQLVFREGALRALLGLASDEQLARIDVDQVRGEVRFVVESPRLPPMPFWDGGPPIITLPIAAHYDPAAA